MKRLMCLVAAGVVAGSSYAASLGEGTQELVVSGLLDPTSYDGMELILDASYGMFVMDGIEAGGGLTYADVAKTTSWGFFGFGEYNIDMGGGLVPFAGARLGWAWAEANLGIEKQSNSAVVLGGYCGVKFFLAQNIAISGQANLDVATDDIYINDDKLEPVNFTLTVGMRFFLPAGTVKPVSR